MTIVVDANVVAAIALPVTYSANAVDKVAYWISVSETLMAPIVFEYEIATIVRRSVFFRHLNEAQAAIVLTRLLDPQVITINPTLELHQQAIALAARIGQSKAYDAHYLALAVRENAPFWTADRRLAAAAQDAGLGWVHWIAEDTIQ
jgi:predicted nucleic acid-binding protein